VLDTKTYLSWKPVSGATGYKVKRATVAGGPYTTVASTSTPSYTDTGLTNNSTYYYLVTATNSTLESAASDPLIAKTTISTAIIKNFEQQIQIFPNPAKHQIKITHAENSKISVTDCLGKLILSHKSQQEVSQIDVSHWTPGIYNVEISKEACLVNRKIIVNR
jgi:hypothetical protein